METAKRTRNGCKRCGSKDVTWQESDRGNWYLSEVFEVDGDSKTDRKEFHSKYCGKPNLHAKAQATLSALDQAEKTETKAARKKSEARLDNESAEHFLTLAGLSPNDRVLMIESLERSMRSFYKNPPTMDYMTEFSREIAEQKQRQTEWKFLMALDGRPKEENFTD